MRGAIEWIRRGERARRSGLDIVCTAVPTFFRFCMLCYTLEFILFAGVIYVRGPLAVFVPVSPHCMGCARGGKFLGFFRGRGFLGW